MSTPPPSQVLPGDQLDLAVDVKNAKAGETVTFTVAAGGGKDVVVSLNGSVASGSAQARWTVDPGTRSLPLAVDITASLRSQNIALGPTIIQSGARVSTLGWLDEKGRVLAVDPSDGARVAAAGDTVILKFDVSDAKGGAAQEQLDFTFILEREASPGQFKEVGRFSDSVSGVTKFERKFTTPNDSSVPGTFRIVVETRRSGETGPTPSLGRRGSPPLKVIVVSPLVTSFQGADPDTGSDHPAEQVFLGPGKSVRLFWDVVGAFQSVRLDPMKKDVKAETSTAHEGAMAGAITIDPVKEPPDADGNYTIVASNQGLDSPPRKVGVVSIAEFTLKVADGQTGKTLIDDRGKPVSEIRGLPEPLKDPAHQVQGEVTPRSKVVLSWKVLGAKGVKLRLKAENSAGDKLLIKDVTAEPEGSLELDDPSKGAVLDAELAVLEDKPQKPAVLARGLIHVREGFPLPELQRFAVLDDGKEVTPDAAGVFAVSSWNKLSFGWLVNGSAVQNHLEVDFKASAGSFHQTFKASNDKTLKNDSTKPAGGGPLDGDVTVDATLLNNATPKNEKQKGSRTLKLKIAPAAPKKHKLTVHVRTSAGPLKGAKVTVTDKSGASKEQTTSDSGDLDFPDLQEGDVTVTARHDLFDDGTRKLPLTSDDTVTLTLAQKAPAPGVTLEAFVRFEAFDVVAKTFVPLDGVAVQAIDDGILDKELDTQTTGADGLAHFQVPVAKRPAGKAVDLKFNVKPAGKVIGGVTFPAEWSTKGWRSPDGTPGMQKGFTGASVGSTTAPLVFRVGLDFHLQIDYRCTPVSAAAALTFHAVQGVSVKVTKSPSIVEVGNFRTDVKGQVHGLTFQMEPGDNFGVNVEDREGFPTIGRTDINLPLTSFVTQRGPGPWRSQKGDADSPVIEDLHDTSIGTPGAPRTFTGTGVRAAGMYMFKVLTEWSTFLFHVTDGAWTGIPGLKLFNFTHLGFNVNSYSFPMGEVNYIPDHWFDRGTIAHELSHQIMWKESDFPTVALGAAFLRNPVHSTNLMTKTEVLPLYEGWSDFLELLFINPPNSHTGEVTTQANIAAGRPPYAVSLLRPFDTDKPPTEALGPPPLNRGHFCEGCFANGLWEVYAKFVGGKQVKDTPDGNSFEAWMDDPLVRARFKSAIWIPLQDMKGRKSPHSSDFLGKMKSMDPGHWHELAPHLHPFNMMMDGPAIASIVPASSAAGAVVTVNGSEFEKGAEVRFNSVAVPAADVTVASSTSLTVKVPAIAKGAANLTVKTLAAESAPFTFTVT